jgi:hypothetical protein
MAEVAINEPFDSGEIMHIISEELQSRMRGLSPLQGGKQYAAFAVDFQVKIRLRRAGETAGESKETLAWGFAQKGELPSAADLEAAVAETLIAEEASHFDSRDPNEERVARDMPLTVESGDGRGGKITRKVRVKSA